MRFYGPATSCEELLKIGYTRNGFYLVKGNATSNNNSQVEIVDCLFKNPNGAKEGKKLKSNYIMNMFNFIVYCFYFMIWIVKEKRLGFIPLKYSAVKSHRRRFIQNLIMIPKVEVDEIAMERPKRPVRLLPSHLL